MIYVAFLRGINVGGKNKIDMKRLKVTFEQNGMESVKTYINSGNIIFQDSSHNTRLLTSKLERAIEAGFGFSVKVLLRDIMYMKAVVRVLPETWVNNDVMKCDVMFLWEAVDSPDVVDLLTIKPAIDDVKYIDGALLWRVDRSNVSRSGMMKLVGTEPYRQMTVRNCNTVRKLLELMNQIDPRA